MGRKHAINLCLSLLVIGLTALFARGQTTREAPPTSAPTASNVVIITLEGDIDDFSRDGVLKRFEKARKLGATHIILSLNTPGGLVTSGLDLSRFLKQQDDLHIVAYIHEKAYSAGIMVGLACDEIVMGPGSYIGDAAPIAFSPDGSLQTLVGAERAKAESPVLADFRDSALKNGYDPLLAEAMVSVQTTVYEIRRTSPDGKTETRFVDEADFTRLTGGATPATGPTQADEPEWEQVNRGRPLDGPETLLTLNDQKAVDTGLAKSIVVNAETLAAERGWVVVGSLAPGAGDKLVSVLSGAAVRGIVFSILMLSLYAALHSPGTGGPEAIALTALGILVGVPMLTGYAQWWEVLAIVAGLGLIAVELFVLPGFGIAGITGLVLLLGGLILTFVGNVPGLPGSWRMPQIMTGVRTGLIVVASAIAASFLLSLWLRQYLPKLPYFSRLILNTTAGATTTTAVGSAPAGEAADVWPFIGTFGLAVSDLRPGGSAEFPYADDKRVAAVVSEGGFIRAGTRLAVREVRGSRIIVRPAEG